MTSPLPSARPRTSGLWFVSLIAAGMSVLLDTYTSAGLLRSAFVKATVEPSRENVGALNTPVIFISCLASPPDAGTENICEVVRTDELKLMKPLSGDQTNGPG